MLRLRATSSSVALLKFSSRDADIETRKQQAQTAFRGLFTIELIELKSSVDAEPNFRKLEGWLRDKYVARGRPLRVLVDITCVPKTYLLFILGLGFTRDYLACLDCLYAAGVYDLNAAGGGADAGRIGGPRALLSEGEWRSRQIPYLEPRDVIASERDIIVTLGGELGLSLPFIEKFEPGRAGLIFIKETAPDLSTPMLQSEKSALLELLREPNAQRSDIGLCDVIGVAKHAVHFTRKSNAKAVTGIAIGSKPHALALGIAALAEDKMEIVCRTPAAYKLAEIQPSGRVFLYTVEDRFEPCSYL